jgi:hypothetical protein
MAESKHKIGKLGEAYERGVRKYRACTQCMFGIINRKRTSVDQEQTLERGVMTLKGKTYFNDG